MQFKTIEQALKFALGKEQAACRFYLDLAAHLSDPLARQLFEQIASEEVEHQAEIELELMKRGVVVSDSVDAGQTTIQKVRTTEPVPDDMVLSEGLNLAIQKEQASYRLYLELYALADDPEVRDALAELAEQEIRHKTRFERALVELGGGHGT